ncbi:MAG: glucose-1-phosphate cytidylyltransferase [Zoogloeaceae bacterium]|jgi:glucose-1-phosphate cytidylyltransferase|nr:glucose-1-phosphate cytidylyltransferase [Zoogloeaceae bacterium]
MKAVILAGGLGTRISEESHLKPKPMIEVGGMPVLWHILKLYSAHGINEFVICLGYKGYVIKEYFANYFLHASDVTFNMVDNSMAVHARHTEPWRVTLVDTGENTQTGGRLKRIRGYLAPDEDFCLTYGDGVGDIDISASIRFHREQGRLATITAALPPSRFGALNIDGELVTCFNEKPAGSEGFINAGFFVLSPPVIDLIEDDRTIWEGTPLKTLAAKKQLAVWRHHGFWQPMDTLRDKNHLEQLWQSGQAPWKTWS